MSPHTLLSCQTENNTDAGSTYNHHYSVHWKGSEVVEMAVEEEMAVGRDMVYPLQTHKGGCCQQNCHSHKFIH